MKRALLITYYWPPAGGPGVHRWLRFSKYFKENDWDLTIYCPENAEWPVIDEGLEKEVSPELEIIRQPIFEPHKFLGKKNNPNKGGAFTHDKKPSLKARFIMWVRGNFFIPDARMFWIKPSVKFLKKYLKEHPEITSIITTGPPHSMHLIGLALKQELGIHWVADFRDPWTQIDFYDELMLSSYADNKHHILEKQVLSKADAVVTISNHCGIGLEEIGKRKVEVITNGFEFKEFNSASFPLENTFTITHLGSMSAARNPYKLWSTLGKLVQENKQLAALLKIKLIGPVDTSIITDIKNNGLDQYLEHIEKVSHSESIEIQRKTPVLLLVANDTGNTKGILTGKFFEYLGAKRPILAFGEKNSDLEQAMNDTQAGYFVDRDDFHKIAEAITSLFEEFLHKKTFYGAINLEQFSSKNLAEKFTTLLK